MIKTRTFISGIEYSDYTTLEVDKSIGESNTSSNFQISYDSPYGRHKTDFTVGNNVLIYTGNGIVGGLISQWRLNEGSGTSVYDNLSSNVGVASGIVWSSISNSGLAVNLNPWLVLNGGFSSSGVAYIDLKSGASVFPSNSGTISFWARGFLGGDGGANDRAPLFILGSNNNFFNGQGTVNNVYRGPIFGIDPVDSWSTNDFGINSLTSSRVTQGTKLVSLTWAGSNNYAFMYHNGSIMGSAIQTITSLGSGTELCLGGGFFSNTAGSAYSNGVISDFRTYNYPLSQSEINTLYNSGSATIDYNIFTGIIENIEFKGDGLDEKLELRGRDYTVRLMDQTVQPVVYTNTEVGSIVRNIITNNTKDIGSGYIQNTGIILPRMVFNQVRVYDAIKQLADVSNFNFYVDRNKNLVFSPQYLQYANTTLGSSNILRTVFDKTREGMANKVWVYGDRYLTAAPTEVKNVGSPNSGGLGSAFTLSYKPYSSQVSKLGSILIGGVFNNTNSNISGTAYLVNFEDKTIIFPSGTTYGYYLPPSGGSVVVNYDRQIPIVKYGEDTNSIQAYGPKTSVTVDKSIKDPQTAISLLNDKLTKSNPLNNLEIDYKGWTEFIPGQVINVAIPNFNITTSGLSIIETRYRFDQDTVNNETPITLLLDQRAIDLTDSLALLTKRITALEGQDMQSSDFLTRLQYATGSMLIVGSRWYIQSNYFIGSEFRLWGNGLSPPGISGTNSTLIVGLLESGTGLGAGSNSYLASGTLTMPSIIITSGGYF